MTRTFIKLHGAWSGEPVYIDASEIVSAGPSPEDNYDTAVALRGRGYALVIESPSDVIGALRNLGVYIVTDPDYDTKYAASLAAIRERAAAKSTEDAPA